MSSGESRWRAEVERIVRDVLAEMAARGDTVHSAKGGELVLSGKVVSLRDLEDRLSGITRLVVRRGAVVTPAARDLLRASQVNIVWN